MMTNPTPEERLLKLIKRKKPEPSQPRAESVQPKAEPGAPNIKRERIEVAREIPDRKTRMKAAPPKARGETGKKSFMELAPKALVLLLVLSIIYLIADILLVTPYYRNKIQAASSTPAGVEEMREEEAVSGEAADTTPVKPYSYYSKDIGSRDIFKPVVQSRKGAVDRGQQSIKEKFSLIGIIAGEELEAAIEDKGASKTYFVFKGDYIDDVLVEDILVNKVILDYRGEKFELML